MERRTGAVLGLATALAFIARGQVATAPLAVELADMPALVAALSDLDPKIRAAAATHIRTRLAADPAIAPNWHEEAFWKERVAKLVIGMTLDEAGAVLFTNEPEEIRRKRIGSSIGQGGSGNSRTWQVQLDDYWSVSISSLIPNNQVSGMGMVAPQVARRWVQPPPGYTGEWTSWYVNGQISTKIDYRDGRYDGSFISYYDNGAKQLHQNYANHIPVGEESGWHRNGQLSYHGQYADGKQDGTWEHWYDNGVRRSSTEYRAGQQHGAQFRWDPNGKLQSEEHYKAGVLHGISKQWDEAGNLLWERLFVNGEVAEPGMLRQNVN
jgi:hypothetical protein